MNENDAVRRALSSAPPGGDAHDALHTLRPRMQRARSRRRAASAAIAATLVAGGTAAAIAIMPDVAPTRQLQTSTIDEVDEVVDPSSTVPDTTWSPASADDASDRGDVSEGNGAQDDPAPPDAPDRLPGPNMPPAVPSDPADTTTPTMAPDTTVSSPAAPAPADTPTPPDPPDEVVPGVPDPPAAAGSLQTIDSACGKVVVLIETGTVRIHSTQPLPGFEMRVSTDGPESIEVKFVGPTESCELHAELHGSGLEIEVQEPEAED